MEISFELESREFNGKWYTDVKAWKIDWTDKPTIEQPEDYHFSTKEISEEDDDILPF